MGPRWGRCAAGPFFSVGGTPPECQALGGRWAIGDRQQGLAGSRASRKPARAVMRRVRGSGDTRCPGDLGWGGVGGSARPDEVSGRRGGPHVKETGTKIGVQKTKCVMLAIADRSSKEVRPANTNALL